MLARREHWNQPLLVAAAQCWLTRSHSAAQVPTPIEQADARTSVPVYRYEWLEVARPGCAKPGTALSSAPFIECAERPL